MEDSENKPVLFLASVNNWKKNSSIGTYVVKMVEITLFALMISL